MHVRDSADLAALLCVHCRPLISANPEPVKESLEVYWTASRCRLDRWYSSIRELTDGSLHVWPAELSPLVEEILVSELLTRTVAAIFTAHDHIHQQTESGPLGRNILDGHVDARRRALHLVGLKSSADHRRAAALDELRRRTERWTDLLLAYLPPNAPIDEFASDPGRREDFSIDTPDHLETAESERATVAMLSAGIHASLAPLTVDESPNGDLNLKLGAAVLGCFGPEFFDSYGLLRSPWLDRLQTVPDEMLALVDEWWRDDPPAPEASFADWWRR